MRINGMGVSLAVVGMGAVSAKNHGEPAFGWPLGRLVSRLRPANDSQVLPHRPVCVDMNQPMALVSGDMMERLRADLDRSGFAVIRGEPCDQIEQQVQSLERCVRSAVPSQLKDRVRSYGTQLRWQKQLIREGASAGSESPWITVSNSNNDLVTARALAESHEIFHLADDYFARMDALIYQACSDSPLDVMYELRLVIPPKNGVSHDTYWHTDAHSVHLTAVTAWAGPGTVYSVLNDPKLHKLPDDELFKQLNGACERAPAHSTLAFYGRGASHSALWHKSPGTVVPRAVLLYRLKLPTERMRIREAYY